MRQISPDIIPKIVQKNCFARLRSSKDNPIQLNSSASLFGIISLINHGKDENVIHHHIGPYLHIIYAARDLKKDQELYYDYQPNIRDKEERDKRMQHWGISET